ncbi:hypothetical protein NPIL_540171 [Nephila pilipes]|uniref:Uncharacterized protein n=1 Tax=Nephila pilipes TaxID=299642 RepID=A0A8X6TBH6_NEPPI|nr:hypothetical protein NPIL_540171 [Nephila pilipes]
MHLLSEKYFPSLSFTTVSFLTLCLLLCPTSPPPRTTPVHHYQGLLSSTSHLPSLPSFLGEILQKWGNRIEAKVSYVISEVTPDGCSQLDIGNAKGTEENGLVELHHIANVFVLGGFFLNLGS